MELSAAAQAAAHCDWARRVYLLKPADTRCGRGGVQLHLRFWLWARVLSDEDAVDPRRVPLSPHLQRRDGKPESGNRYGSLPVDVRLWALSAADIAALCFSPYPRVQYLGTVVSTCQDQDSMPPAML